MASPKSFLLFNILLFFYIANYQVSALKCYACTVNIGDIDQRCITNPEAVQIGQPIVNCNYDYCTSRRVEFKDPPDTVQSMQRGCQSDPEQMNTIIEDDQFITYYRACRRDLCNSGTGKGGDGGVGFDPETGEESVIFVNGINKARQTAGGVDLMVVLGAAVVLAVVGAFIGFRYKKHRKNKSQNATDSKKQKASTQPKNNSQMDKSKRH